MRCDDVVVQPGRLGDVKLVIVCLLTPTEQPRHKLNCKYFQLSSERQNYELGCLLLGYNNKENSPATDDHNALGIYVLCKHLSIIVLLQ